jgi:hypothetical protein
MSQITGMSSMPYNIYRGERHETYSSIDGHSSIFEIDNLQEAILVSLNKNIYRDEALQVYKR